MNSIRKTANLVSGKGVFGYQEAEIVSSDEEHVISRYNLLNGVFFKANMENSSSDCRVHLAALGTTGHAINPLRLSLSAVRESQGAYMLKLSGLPRLAGNHDWEVTEEGTKIMVKVTPYRTLHYFIISRFYDFTNLSTTRDMRISLFMMKATIGEGGAVTFGVADEDVGWTPSFNLELSFGLGIPEFL